MFEPECPSSGEQVVVFQDSAAHNNAVFLLLLGWEFWLAIIVKAATTSQPNKIKNNHVQPT
jgi:hypothetical protein